MTSRDWFAIIAIYIVGAVAVGLLLKNEHAPPRIHSVSVSVLTSPDDPYFMVSRPLVEEVLDRLNTRNNGYQFTLVDDDEDADVVVVWGSLTPICQMMPWGIEIGVPEGPPRGMQAELQAHLLDCLINAAEVDVE